MFKQKPSLKHSLIICILYLVKSDWESSLEESDEISPPYVPNSGLRVTDRLSTLLTSRTEMPVTSTVLKEQITR